MNKDLETMIEICSRPRVQELIREVWPEGFEGYVWDEVQKRLVFHDNADEFFGKEPLLPFGFSSEHCAHQIDVLLMRVLGIDSFESFGHRYSRFLDTRVWHMGHLWKNRLDHSDLYLKILMLSDNIGKPKIIQEAPDNE